jgi:hypothetical protein
MNPMYVLDKEMINNILMYCQDRDGNKNRNGNDTRNRSLAQAASNIVYIYSTYISVVQVSSTQTRIN